MKHVWQLQEAKNRLSEVIDSAVEDGHQTITRHGRPTAVVLSIKEFERLTQPKKSVKQLFHQSTVKGLDLETRRSKDPARKVHL